MNFHSKSLVILFSFFLSHANSAQKVLESAVEIGGYQRNSASNFVRDADMLSPKSAHFSGSKLYVNALERGATIVYDTTTWAKTEVIEHKKNGIMGKPVEIAETDNYLWIPYYRLSTDESGTQKSKIGMFEKKTQTMTWLDAGNVPKMVQTYKNNTIAVSNWGENLVSIYDIEPGQTQPKRTDVVVERKYTPIAGTNRDSQCGFCLRGLAFTPKGEYLLVGRMGGGGIAVIRMADKTYVGTLTRVPLTPRHLVVSPDGKILWLSTSHSQEVARLSMSQLMESIKKLEGDQEITAQDMPWNTVSMGGGVRTIVPSRDGKWIYAAVHGKSDVVVIDTQTLTIEQRIPVASYPVGLAVSADDQWIAVTQQGVQGKGGNHVDVLKRLPSNLQ